MQPKNKEKHWLVTEVVCDEEDVPQSCVLEAVLTRRSVEFDWRVLKNESQWAAGWK